jgi:hypothetical protein
MGVEVNKVPRILELALDGYEKSASRSGRFIIVKVQVAHIEPVTGRA